MPHSGRIPARIFIIIILVITVTTAPVASQVDVSSDQQVSTNSSPTEPSSIERL